MKKYSILLLLSFVLLSLGCKDDNNSTNPDDNGGKNNPLTSQGLVCEIDGKEFKFETCYVMSNTPVEDY